MLIKAVNKYLDIRHAAGFEMDVPGYLLRSFARFATKRKELHISTQTAIQWASLAPSLSQRRRRLHEVIRLARHLIAEDPHHQIPPGDVFGPKPKRRVPYIFSNKDICSLVREAYKLGPSGSLRPYTYATLFSLLSATGIRISEALAFRLHHITGDGLVIRKTKFKKSRLVPLHDTAKKGLNRYLKLRKRIATNNDHLFISHLGGVLSYYCVKEVIKDLVRKIGLKAPHNCSKPRLHAFRHTFAVKALESFRGVNLNDVGCHMLALSTYMGHSNVADTYWYLEATPQLMVNIAEDCEKFMKKEK